MGSNDSILDLKYQRIYMNNVGFITGDCGNSTESGISFEESAFTSEDTTFASNYSYVYVLPFFLCVLF